MSDEQSEQQVQPLSATELQAIRNQYREWVRRPSGSILDSIEPSQDEYVAEDVLRLLATVEALQSDVQQRRQDIGLLLLARRGEPQRMDGEAEHFWNHVASRHISDQDEDEPGALKLRLLTCTVCGQTWVHS